MAQVLSREQRKFQAQLLCNENKLCLIESCWIGNGFRFLVRNERDVWPGD